MTKQFEQGDENAENLGFEKKFDPLESDFIPTADITQEDLSAEAPENLHNLSPAEIAARRDDARKPKIVGERAYVKAREEASRNEVKGKVKVNRNTPDLQPLIEMNRGINKRIEKLESELKDPKLEGSLRKEKALRLASLRTELNPHRKREEATELEEAA